MWRGFPAMCWIFFRKAARYRQRGEALSHTPKTQTQTQKSSRRVPGLLPFRNAPAVCFRFFSMPALQQAFHHGVSTFCLDLCKIPRRGGQSRQDPGRRSPFKRCLTAVLLPSSWCFPRSCRSIPSGRPHRRIGRSSRPCRYSASAPGRLHSAPPQRHCQGRPR